MSDGEQIHSAMYPGSFAGDRSDAAAGIFHDLGLLVSIQPSRCVYDKAAGFERVLANIDLRLLGEPVSCERTRIHR